mgnify:CR=1 FL=1
MRKLFFSAFGAFFLLLSASWILNDFKAEQLRYKRVREAYAEKETAVKAVLEKHNIEQGKLTVYIRAFKEEGLLELWGKNNSDKTYQLLETIAICESSGQLGPKRKQGDRQVPEGFYHIDRFNPASNFYLSLGINYPNKSDRILGNKQSLGGDIFIHGNCVTIGCIPITNTHIQTVYLYCVEAKNNGQQNIPVTIFPFVPSQENMKKHGTAEYQEFMPLWSSLMEAHTYFMKHKSLPSIGFNTDGSHTIY